MRLFVVGATGGTGIRLLEQGLQRGHEITAFVRSPAGIPFQNKRLRIVQGDLFQPEQIAAALPGHDAVLSAFGPRDTAAKTIQRDFARALVTAMGQAGAPRRLLIVSTAFVFTDALLPALFGRLFFRAVQEDAGAMEQIVRASPLDWTIVRPPRLTDGSATSGYRILAGHLPPRGLSIDRSQVADFVLNEAEQAAYVRQIVGIAR